jgi:hypothetical protein
MSYRMKGFGLLLVIVAGLSADGCTSGKGALNRGDYSSAVLAAVQRLRQNPDHKKSRQVLQMSYTLAVQYFDTEAQNSVNSNQPFKWRTALQNYGQINRMYEEIRTSPGALAVIPKPENRFTQVEELKVKAAEESYQAGIAAMMRDSRTSYREAYGYFEETNRLSQGYREAIEMQEKARENATLFVIVGRTRFSDIQDVNQDFQQDLQSCGLPFIRFFNSPPENLAKYTLWVDAEIITFRELRPQLVRSEETFRDSVKSGEKKVGDKTIATYDQISAKVVVFTRTFRAEGALKVIVYGENHEAAFSRTFERATEEHLSWATYTGDERALPERIRRLVRQRESNTSRVRQLLHQEIEKDIRSSYCSFLDRY